MSNQFYESFRESENSFFSLFQLQKVSKPELIGWSEPLAQEIGLDLNFKEASQTDDLKQILSGNQFLTSDIKPFSTRYGGHQFGHWAGQLGDGRAVLLGEVSNYEIQLKGAGKTVYSRRGDGRAVLRSSLREFVCSEAMQALGIPTTRALSLMLTGESVLRDMLYDGNVQGEPGAIVSRLSPSFIRFGHFEILSADRDYQNLKKLADWIIDHFYSEIKILNGPEKYTEFLKQVSIRTAEMIAQWMSVGFVHGVMNTDNMSILGLTIDYGPYGWLEEYDPDFTPNTTDFSHRRYRYINQPDIGLWNLNCLAHALFPLIEDKDLVVKALENYEVAFKKKYEELFSAKLGIPFDKALLTQLFDLMFKSKIDFTRFFRKLSEAQLNLIPETVGDFLKDVSYKSELVEDEKKEWIHWFQQYLQNKNIDQNQMKQSNPSLIFRNYMAFEITQQFTKGHNVLEKYLEPLTTPYESRDLFNDPLTFKRPSWADNQRGCSFLSCSS